MLRLMYKILSQFSLYLLLINSRKTSRKLQCGSENKEKRSIRFSAPTCRRVMRRSHAQCPRGGEQKKQDTGCSIWAHMSSAAEMCCFCSERSDVTCFQESAIYSFPCS